VAICDATTKNVIAQLQHVRRGNGPIDLRYFPDFLIVGPQRTGTTWLSANLRLHPQIFIPAVKELHFFSKLNQPDARYYSSSDLDWYLRCFRETPGDFTKKTIASLIRFRELYHPRVRGEATASYAVLERGIIQDIVTLNPEIKVLFFIRNPVDRAWSHAKKGLLVNRTLDEVPDSAFEEFFQQPFVRKCAKFTENIDRWSEMVPPGHVHVGLFDEIRLTPSKVLFDVFKFLGVKAARKYVPETVTETANPSEQVDIPERHKRFLTQLLQPELRSLEQRYGLHWP